MFESVLKFLEENKIVTLLIVFLVVYYLMNRKAKKMEGMAVVNSETKQFEVGDYVGLEKKITLKTMIDGTVYYLAGIPSKFCGINNSQCGNSLVLIDDKSNNFVNKKYKLESKRRRLYCNVDEYLKEEMESGVEKVSVTVPESKECEIRTLNCNEFSLKESSPDKFTKEYNLMTSPGSLETPSVTLSTVNYVDNKINNKKEICIDSPDNVNYQNQIFVIPVNGGNKIKMGFKLIKDNKSEYLYFCANKNNTCKVPIGGSKSLTVDLGQELVDGKANPEILEFEVIRN